MLIDKLFSEAVRKSIRLFLAVISLVFAGGVSAFDCNMPSPPVPNPNVLYDCTAAIYGVPYYSIGNNGVYGNMQFNGVQFPSESAALDAARSIWLQPPYGSISDRTEIEPFYTWTVPQLRVNYVLYQANPPFPGQPIGGILIFQVVPISCPPGFTLYTPLSGNLTTPGPSMGYPCYRSRIVIVDNIKIPPPPDTCIGNPIFPLTGAKIERLETEFRVGSLGVNLTYNSSARLPLASGVVTTLPLASSPLGDLWTSNVFRKLIIRGSAPHTLTVEAVRGNGYSMTYRPQGNQKTGWSANSNDRLLQTANGWLYYDYANLAVEAYSSDGMLESITFPSGDILSFIYSTSSTGASVAPIPGLLIRIDDSRGRSIHLTYMATSWPGSTGPVLASMADDSGRTIAFTYDTNRNLSQVVWPDSTVRSFKYEQLGLPWALTRIVDENGKTFASFAFDSDGRAVSTERAGGVDKFSVSYASPPSINVVETFDSNANIRYRTFQFGLASGINVLDSLSTSSAWAGTIAAGRPDVSTRGQAAGSGCASSVMSKSFDGNGVASVVNDFNGGRVCIANDDGNPIERVEGLSPAQSCSSALGGISIPQGSRKISTRRHSSLYNVWNGLEIQRAEPGKITYYIYNGAYDDFTGSISSCATPVYPDGAPISVLCRVVESATTDTNGQLGFSASRDNSVALRISSWTYDSAGRVLTVNGPRSDVVDTSKYEYYPAAGLDYAKGDLWKETNALQQTTTYDKYNTAGQVLQSTDANGVVTIYTYDSRRRLRSRSIAGQTISYDYDAAGQLTRVTASDSSWIGYEYDDAHRMVAIKDNLGNRVDYQLDSVGNRVSEMHKNASGDTRRLLSRGIDALGRIQQVTGRGD